VKTASVGTALPSRDDAALGGMELWTCPDTPVVERVLAGDVN
jgi:hypothetical protein